MSYVELHIRHGNKTIHKTISSRVKVYYPFHPLAGLELEVVCATKKEDGAVTVIDPVGFSLKIPLWMTSPQAVQYGLSDRAELSARALVSLVSLLKPGDKP